MWQLFTRIVRLDMTASSSAARRHYSDCVPFTISIAPLISDCRYSLVFKLHLESTLAILRYCLRHLLIWIRHNAVGTLCNVKRGILFAQNLDIHDSFAISHFHVDGVC